MQFTQSPKQALRQQLITDTQAFLENGGVIEQCPPEAIGGKRKKRFKAAESPQQQEYQQLVRELEFDATIN